MLFDLFNRIRAADGALISSGDAAPAQLALREDLRSRLAGLKGVLNVVTSH